MDDNIIREKIEIAIDLICQLHRHNIITDAHIFGSSTDGTATKDIRQ